MRRFYFTSKSHFDVDNPANVHCGNIRGARTVAQKLANELDEIVFINDCETSDIVDFVEPDPLYKLGYKVGDYKLGKYPAIIKKIYEDGTFDYETNFTSSSDLFESVRAYRRLLNTIIGVATDNPRLLVGFSVISGIDDIIAELVGV